MQESRYRHASCFYRSALALVLCAASNAYSRRLPIRSRAPLATARRGLRITQKFPIRRFPLEGLPVRSRGPLLERLGPLELSQRARRRSDERACRACVSDDVRRWDPIAAAWAAGEGRTRQKVHLRRQRNQASAHFSLPQKLNNRSAPLIIP